MAKAIWKKYHCDKAETPTISWSECKKDYDYGYPNEPAYSNYIFTKDNKISLTNFIDDLRNCQSKGQVYFYCSESNLTSDTSIKKGYYDKYYNNSFGEGRIKISMCYSGYVKMIISKIKGIYIENVVADVGFLPIDGEFNDGYWYVYQGLAPPNPPSKITLPKQLKGGKSNLISWNHATSEGAAISGYVLQCSLDGGEFKQIYKGKELSYLDNITFGTKTIQYRVCSYDIDNQFSDFTTSENKIVINNNPPVISGTDTNMGNISDGFTFTYKVTDKDLTDEIRVVEKLDEIILKDFNAQTDTDYIANVTENVWFPLLNGKHILTICAIDSRGEETIRTITFTKATQEIEFMLETPLECNEMVSKAIMQVAKQIPDNAQFEIYACNNGFDPEPTWEDVTQKVIMADKIFFKNRKKVGVSWGYNFKVIIKRNNAIGECFITSVSGNFE